MYVQGYDGVRKMSRGRLKKDRQAAARQARIDEELNGWLVFVQAKAEAEGLAVPTHNDIIKEAMLSLYPDIKQASLEYQQEQDKLMNAVRRIHPGNGSRLGSPAKS
jgi:hypothetical protein